MELEAGVDSAGKADSYGRPQPFRLDQITGVMNALGTVGIFGLLVLINVDIVGRSVFNSPLRGTTELVSLAIVGIVFMQLPNTLWAGRFVRAELLIDVACVALNRLTPRYIRHEADFAFFLSDRERADAELAVSEAVEYAFGFVQARTAMRARG